MTDWGGAVIVSPRSDDSQAEMIIVIVVKIRHRNLCIVSFLLAVKSCRTVYQPFGLLSVTYKEKPTGGHGFTILHKEGVSLF